MGTRSSNIITYDVEKYWKLFVIYRYQSGELLWTLVMFRFQIWKQVNIFYQVKKTFCCKTINFYVKAEQQSWIKVFVLLGMTLFQTRDLFNKTQCVRFTVPLAQTSYSKTFNSEWNERSCMAVSYYRGIYVGSVWVAEKY